MNQIVEVISQPQLAIEVVDVDNYLIEIFGGDNHVIEVGLATMGPRGPKGESIYKPSSPHFFWDGDVLTRINYSDGSYKLFSYTSGALNAVSYTKDAVTLTKTFHYRIDGKLDFVSESTS